MNRLLIFSVFLCNAAVCFAGDSFSFFSVDPASIIPRTPVTLAFGQRTKLSQSDPVDNKRATLKDVPSIRSSTSTVEEAMRARALAFAEYNSFKKAADKNEFRGSYAFDLYVDDRKGLLLQKAQLAEMRFKMLAHMYGLPEVWHRNRRS